MPLPLIRTLVKRTCFITYDLNARPSYQPLKQWIRLNSLKQDPKTTQHSHTEYKSPDPVKPPPETLSTTRVSAQPSSNKPTQPELKETKEKDVPKAVGKYSRQAVKQNVQGYVFTRYIDYVKNYDKLLAKSFPQAATVYNTFFEGVKLFLSDLKQYIKIWRIANISEKGLDGLNRKEIELIMQMPKDMIQVAPTLLFSALPFVGYAIFPVAYAKPRYFLSSHFWTIQQKTEFHLLNLKDRLLYNKIVFRYLQSKLKSNKSHPLYDEWRSVLGLIGSGQHPNAEQILAVKDLFSSGPYSYHNLPSSHIKNLCHNHGISARLFKKNRLLEHAYLIHNMDLAIKREGDVHNMQLNALRKSCYLRGLNPSNLTNEQMIDWLREWVKVSLALEEDQIGLFVHLPILLTYNHPNNWKLIYH